MTNYLRVMEEDFSVIAAKSICFVREYEVVTTSGRVLVLDAFLGEEGLETVAAVNAVIVSPEVFWHHTRGICSKLQEFSFNIHKQCFVRFVQNLYVL